MAVEKLTHEILSSTVLIASEENRFAILRERGKKVIWIDLDQKLHHNDMLPLANIIAPAVGFAGGIKSISEDRNNLLIENGGSSIIGYELVWEEYKFTHALLQAMLEQIGKGGRVIKSSL